MTRSNPTRSIHDTDAQATRRPRRKKRVGGPSRKVVTVATIVAAVGLGGTAVAVNLAGGAATSDLSKAPAQGSSALDVLIDGWSLRTLEDRAVTAQWAGGAPRQVTFEPVTQADLRELLTSSPELVQAAVARQLDASADLSCSAQGCVTSAGQIDVADLLLQGDSEPQKLLRGHGVEAGLLKARLEVPEGVSTVTVSADGYGGAVLSVGEVLGDPGEDGEAQTLDPFLGNGFQQGRWLVSAGLGQVFVPDVAWLGGDEVRGARFAHRAGDLPADAPARAVAAGAVPAVTGLGTPLPQASTWSASQLTLATSPSQGCTAGVLCYPGTLNVPSGGPTDPQVAVVQSGDAHGVVTVDDRVVPVSLPAPIVQAGVDGNLEGDVELRFLTVTLYGGADVSPVDWAGLVDTTDREQYSVADVLTNVRLGGKTWTLSS